MQNQSNTAQISEIFSSIQGEGPYAGCFHTFVRFTSCNLSCSYCDTDFRSHLKTYSTDELFDVLSHEPSDTLSLTGGEPLLEVDFLLEFLEKYKTKLNKKIYLETNGTLHKNLEKIIKYVDIVSMDIKIKSATRDENKFFENEEFIKVAQNKELFIKVVFDENIEDSEIFAVSNLAQKYNLLIVLQPKNPMKSDLDLISIYQKFYQNHKNTRLIPQIHKFLDLA